MNDGHRERVREKYRKNGLNGFESYEVLELLLFYANKRSDTKPLAKELINRFGSLHAVLEAPYEELINVPGVGDTTATLLSLVPNVFRKYLEDKTQTIKTVDTLAAATDFLRPRFFGLETEHVGLLCLDAKKRIINFTFISDGSLNLAQIDVRKAAHTALRNNAESVIFAHNHPGGLPMPSRADVETTQTLIKVFGSLNIKVADHIIISDNEWFSMAGSEKFAPMFMVGGTALAAKTKFSLY